MVTKIGGPTDETLYEPRGSFGGAPGTVVFGIDVMLTEMFISC